MKSSVESGTLVSSSIETQRHSLSHILAMAVLDMFPEAKLAIGPAIDNGFYYDFELPRTLIPEDLDILTEKMKKIISEDLPFERSDLSRDKAQDVVRKINQSYKAELIDDIPKEESISFYRTGRYFIDLCRGPHVESTGKISASWKLTKIAGAYWKGDEKNTMLQRVYGVAFETQQQLDDYLVSLEEAERRDHRRLGKEQELFFFDDEVGPGLALWLPKGALLRHLVLDFAFSTYLQRGYDPVASPHLASSKLWKHSGHLDFYGESMYAPFGIEDEEYRLKPMNCPFHVRMYKNRRRSYRELPLRWTEMGTVYRYERTGTLHGLTRVRGFTQDDAHIICREDQLESELFHALELTKYILGTFGFDKFEVNVSVRDPQTLHKFIGDDSKWKFAEDVLIRVLKKAGFDDYVFDVGGAVFYGPKIDVKVADAIGRKWQLSTIQFDFNLPHRFDMTYVTNTGAEETPYMIHRALLGSVDRFLGVLIEHYAGKFPVWLAPVQVTLIPITDAQLSYVQKVQHMLQENGIRTSIDERSEKMQAKIRDAQLQYIPYMLVVGHREEEARTVAPRRRDGVAMDSMSLEVFTEHIKKEIHEKVIW